MRTDGLLFKFGLSERSFLELLDLDERERALINDEIKRPAASGVPVGWGPSNPKTLLTKTPVSSTTTATTTTPTAMPTTPTSTTRPPKSAAAARVPACIADEEAALAEHEARLKEVEVTEAELQRAIAFGAPKKKVEAAQRRRDEAKRLVYEAEMYELKDRRLSITHELQQLEKKTADLRKPVAAAATAADLRKPAAAVAAADLRKPAAAVAAADDDDDDDDDDNADLRKLAAAAAPPSTAKKSKPTSKSTSSTPTAVAMKTPAKSKAKAKTPVTNLRMPKGLDKTVPIKCTLCAFESRRGWPGFVNHWRAWHKEAPKPDLSHLVVGEQEREVKDESE